MKKNGNGSVDRRLSFLERVCAEDRERWKRNDKRLEHILRVIQREMLENEERWKKNEERWQKNDARLDAMIKTLYRRAEGQA